MDIAQECRAHWAKHSLRCEDGLSGAMALPEPLGPSRPRTYLILVQNDDELRPTGGFISGVARLVLDRGREVELAFEVDGISLSARLGRAESFLPVGFRAVFWEVTLCPILDD